MCTNCGARLPVPQPGQTAIACSYCGTATPVAVPRPPTVQLFRVTQLAIAAPVRRTISPAAYAVIAVVVLSVIGAVLSALGRRARVSNEGPTVFGKTFAVGEQVMWGLNAPAIGDLDGDGVEDFAGIIRTVTPDAVYAAAFSGASFKQMWRSSALGTWSEAYGATQVAIASGRVVVTSFHRDAKVYEGRTGAEVSTFTLSDQAERICSSGTKVFIDTKDKSHLQIELASLTSSKPSVRPDWCPEGDTSCRNIFKTPHARCTSKSGAIGNVTGFQTERVFYDGDTAVALGFKWPGTPIPMAVGWDTKQKRSTWKTTFTTSPSVREGAPRVADVFNGKLVAYYEMKTGLHHVIAIETKTGKIAWDIELPQSSMEFGPEELNGSSSRIYVPLSTWLDILDAKTGKVLQTVGQW